MNRPVYVYMYTDMYSGYLCTISEVERREARKEKKGWKKIRRACGIRILRDSVAGRTSKREFVPAKLASVTF